VVSQVVAEALGRIVGAEDVLLDESSIESYSLDAFGRWGSAQPDLSPQRVYAAVRPSSTAEVVEVVKLAHHERVPLVPYGAGTGVAGAIAPMHGGIAVDLKRMNRVIALDPDDRSTTVEAGILLGDLDRAISEKGLMVGHDPYSVPIATVGGAISTNGVGYRAAKYGSMGDQVLGLEVVLPTGEVLQTRAVPKSSVGPSLHHLFIGSEGVFGIITRATIRVFRLPEARVFKAFIFPLFEDGFNAMQEMFSLGLRPALVDLSEESKAPSSDATANPSRRGETRMYLVFEGYAEEVEAQVVRTLKVCNVSNGEDAGPALAQEYWDTRHDSAYRYRERFLNKSLEERPSQDWHRRTGYPHVALPASRVLEYRRRCEEIISGRPLWVREYSLWTQPELFSMMLLDVSLEGNDEVESLSHVVDELLVLAQDMGGSMEYVHGVGVKLAHLVPGELGAGMDVLRGIKAALDPNNIMNPGRLGL
jgi:FAD/FMN-containing dehydrogenase